MSKNKREINKRAEKLNYPKEQIVSVDSEDYYLAPRGIKNPKLKRMYAHCRSSGGKKEICGGLVWKKQNESIEDKINHLLNLYI